MKFKEIFKWVWKRRNFIWSQFGQVNFKSLKVSLLFSNKILGFFVAVCYLMQRSYLILCSSIWNLSCSSPTCFNSSPTKFKILHFGFLCVLNLKQHWLWAVQYEICTWFSQRGFENGEISFGRNLRRSISNLCKFSLLFSNNFLGFFVGVCYLMQRSYLTLCSSIWNFFLFFSNKSTSFKLSLLILILCAK